MKLVDNYRSWQIGFGNDIKEHPRLRLYSRPTKLYRDQINVRVQLHLTQNEMKRKPSAIFNYTAATVLTNRLSSAKKEPAKNSHDGFCANRSLL